MAVEPPKKPELPPKPLPDDALPPVAPPTAGFILQLFLIPMVIVMIVVTVWVMFSWLAHIGSDPKDLVRGLRQGDDPSWQKAGALADLLRDQQHAHLKNDPELARELADALETQIDLGRMDEQNVKLRIFICRALGEFNVPDGLPALLRAATIQREELEIGVRRAALEAIAILAKNVGPQTLHENEELFEVLHEASIERTEAPDEQNTRGELRSTAAFAYGVIGGEQSLNELDRMLGDPYANVRYNAATGLSRHGDVRAMEALIEMLDPDNEQTVADEPFETGREFKRTLVMTNAAKAAKLLAKGNADADLGPLEEALAAIEKSDVGIGVKVAAADALEAIRSRGK